MTLRDFVGGCQLLRAPPVRNVHRLLGIPTHGTSFDDGPPRPRCHLLPAAEQPARKAEIAKRAPPSATQRQQSCATERHRTSSTAIVVNPPLDEDRIQGCPPSSKIL
ncbi:unnamed protein product [Lampetra planeri]